MNTPINKSRRNALLPPLMLAIVFGGPLALAVLAYVAGTDWLRSMAGPLGELVDPPVALAPQALVTPKGDATRPDWFRHRWTLLYVRGSACESQCLDEIHRLASVRLALGRDQQRVQLAYLLADPVPPLEGHPMLIVGRLNGAGGPELVDLLGSERVRDGRIFIVDPQGRLVTTYPLPAEQKAIHSDLKRLLRVSKLG
jgi:cytochrome oxidase Cu insertion factor (SCO1/SenC/PrrC family)